MVIRLHKKRTMFILVFLLLLFQQAFLFYTSGIIHKIVSYSDEIIECMLLFFIAIKAFKKNVQLTRIELQIVVCYVVFLIFGLGSSFMKQMQGIFVTLSDVLVCSKFLVFYFSVRILLPKTIDYKELLLELAKCCRTIAIILFVLAVHDLLFKPLFPKREFRYFMYALQLCFSHPTYMAVACISCVSVLIGAIGCEENVRSKKKNMACIVLLLLLTVSTLRSKAIAAVFCVIFFYILLVKCRIFSRTLIFSGGAFVAGVIGADQLIFYYASNVSDFVRARLLLDSLNLAKKNFPFGTGFATFGSALAAEHYSPLYTELGYNILYGGNKQNPKYLCDSFWPTVIAQTGWIGTIAFAGIVMNLLRIPFQQKRQNPYFLWGMLSILTYELISSIAEPAFFNPPAVILMVIFGLMVNICEENEDFR